MLLQPASLNNLTMLLTLCKSHVEGRKATIIQIIAYYKFTLTFFNESELICEIWPFDRVNIPWTLNQ